MLYDRRATVQIGEPGKEGVELTGLRTVFSVYKTKEKSANKAEVTLYNLGPDTLAKITRLNNVLILYAGYVDEGYSDALFTGNITRLHTEKDGTDRITKIECLDGIRALRETPFSCTYSAGTSVMTALKDVVKALDLPLSEKLLCTDSFPKNFTFVGSAKDALSKLCGRLDKEWSVQDGLLQVIDTGGLNKRTVIYLSYDTGLVRMEELSDVRNDIVPSSKSNYRVTSLLMPKLSPAGKVRIKTDKKEANYKIITVEHRGDTHGSEWNTQCEVSEL